MDESGATITISASVPEHLVELIRESVGKRGFSKFVTQSLKREILRLRRLEYVAEFEAEHGKISQDDLDWARRALAD